MTWIELVILGNTHSAWAVAIGAVAGITLAQRLQSEGVDFGYSTGVVHPSRPTQTGSKGGG